MSFFIKRLPWGVQSEKERESDTRHAVYIQDKISYVEKSNDKARGTCYRQRFFVKRSIILQKSSGKIKFKMENGLDQGYGCF